MTYADAHLLLRALGFFGQNANSPVEQWTCSLRIHIGLALPSEASKVAFLEAIAPAWTSFQNNPKVGAHQYSFLQALSCAYIGTDGKYVGGDSQPTTIRPYQTPVPGWSANGTPFQVARVYTLRTALGRGRGHVGRFYWPCAIFVGGDGRWGATDCVDAAFAAKTALEATNAAAKAAWNDADGVSVYSPLGAPHQVVNAVEVGRVPDTQRRRTKALEEDPQSASIAGTLSAVEYVANKVYS